MMFGRILAALVAVAVLEYRGKAAEAADGMRSQENRADGI